MNDINDLLTRSLRGVYRTASPAEREKLYAAIKAAIRAGDMELAHLSLLELVRVDHENPEYWLLLAWTSPNWQSAETTFTRLVVRYPNHPMAKGKVPWSGKPWGQAVAQVELVSEVDTEAAAGIASITSSDAGETPALAAPAPAVETPPEAARKVVSDSASKAGRKAARSAALAEAPPLDVSQQDENAAAAPLVVGGVRVSQREAQWLAGVIPGVGGADGEGAAPAAALAQTEIAGEQPLAAAPDEPGSSIANERGVSATEAEWIENMRRDSAQGEEIKPAIQAWAGAAGLLVSSGLRQLVEKIRQFNFTTMLVVYMLGITLAEVLTSFVNPHLGLVVHGALLVLILAHSAVREGNKEQRFLLALGMAPLIRLMSLSMPLLQFDYVYWYMIIGIPLLVAAAVVYRLSGFKAAQVGLGWGELLPAQVVIGLSGVGLGFMEYLILKPQPLVESFNLKDIWLPALILLVFTGFLEELIFRGLMQRASVNTLKKYGPVYISLLFAVLHIGYKSWVDLAFVFLVGFAFSIVVERTRSLVGVTVAHGLTNISLFLVFPFVVGAQLSLPAILPPPSEPIVGPAIWSGSLELEPRPTRTPLMMVTDTPTLPAPTETLVASPLPELTATPVPTKLPTNTPTRAPTSTPVPSKTAPAAVVPSASATASPTITLFPTATVTLPPTATATETLIPTDILPVEPTAAPTNTPASGETTSLRSW